MVDEKVKMEFEKAEALELATQKQQELDDVIQV
jgi:hypothetical protein